MSKLTDNEIIKKAKEHNLPDCGWAYWHGVISFARALLAKDDLAGRIHYPEHWDVTAYPTVLDAAKEILASAHCSQCDESVASAVPILEPSIVELLKNVRRINSDFDDFDGDRRGIAECLYQAERKLLEALLASPTPPDKVENEHKGKWGEHTQDVLYDSAYVAGAKFGWNCCVDNDIAGFNKAIELRVTERSELRVKTLDKSEPRASQAKTRQEQP